MPSTTNSILKPFLKSTAVYSVSIVASKMAGFVLLPLYTRYLTTTDYGVLELMELTLFVVSTLFGMRLGDGLMYYYAKAETPRDSASVVTSSLLGGLALGAAGALLGYLAAPLVSALVFNSTQYTGFFRLIFCNFALALPVEVGFCYIRALDRSVVYMVASLAQLGLSIASNVYVLTALHAGISGLLWAKLATSTLMLAGTLIYGFSQIRFSWHLKTFVLLVRYSAPLGIGGLGFLIIHYGDRFVLQHYVTLAQVGIYALAYKLGMLVSYFGMPFELYWSAQKYNLVRGAEGDKLFVRVCTYQALCLGFVVVGLSLFSEPMLHVMVAPAYWPAAQYVPWIAFAYWIRMIGSHFRNVFFLQAETQRDAAVIWSSALVCIVAYALLIPRYQLWGAVIATCGAFGVMLVIALWQANQVRRFQYEYTRLAGVCFAIVGTVALYSISRPHAVWSQVGYAACLCLLYPMIVLVPQFLRKDEVLFLRRIASELGWR
jgi:O-antigen/teichoic acid export membrane protein